MTRTFITLDQILGAGHGVPKRIRCDNGPEFISSAIKKWLSTLGVDVLYIEERDHFEKA